MHKRVAVGSAEHAAIRPELLRPRTVARDAVLVHAVIPHQPPFIMVAAKPDFCNVVKRLIFKDFLLGQVAMVVKNRHPLGIVEVQSLRRLVGQQKISFQVTHGFSFFKTVGLCPKPCLKTSPKKVSRLSGTFIKGGSSVFGLF